MLEYLDIYENVLSTFSGQYIQLALNFKTVPKKMRLAKKDANNKKSTILFKIA